VNDKPQLTVKQLRELSLKCQHAAVSNTPQAREATLRLQYLTAGLPAPASPNAPKPA
jgi:hypothetical protein